MKNRVREVLAAAVNVNPDSITEDSSVENIVSWDSLRHMSVILALEEEFSIEFDDNDVLELTSFQKLYEAIQSKLNE